MPGVCLNLFPQFLIFKMQSKVDIKKPFRLALAQGICRTLPPFFSQSLRSLLYPARLAYQDDYPFEVRAQTGSLFRSHTRDIHAYPFSVHGYYEWRIWAIALAVCLKGDTIIEVGSNVGTETIAFSDILGPTGRVYAFEPVPENLASLNLNFASKSNVSIMAYAVGQTEGEIKFILPPEGALSGIGYIANTQKERTQEGIRVPCRSLDSFKGIQKLKLICIDAEGAEVDILKGAENVIRRFSPFIICEYSEKLLKRSGVKGQDLRGILERLNYKIFKIGRWGITALREKSGASDVNWLCIHNSNLSQVEKVRKSISLCGILPLWRGLNPLAGQ